MMNHTIRFLDTANVTFLLSSSSISSSVTRYDDHSSAINASLSHVNTSERLEPWCTRLEASDLAHSPTYYTASIRHLVAAIFLVLLLFTVIGNSVVIVVVIIDRKLRRITSGLIISMALADLMVGLSVELHGVIMLFQQASYFHSFSVLCKLSLSADIYFCLCELLHLVCLALERYVAICHPFLYERCGKKFLTSIIVLTWTIPLAFSFLPIAVFWRRVQDEKLHSCLTSLHLDVCAFFPNKVFSLVLFVVMFLLPTVLLLFCYTQILRVSLTHRKKIGTQVNLGTYFDTQDALYQDSLRQAQLDSTTLAQEQNASCVDETLNLNTINFAHKVKASNSEESEGAFLESDVGSRNGTTSQSFTDDPQGRQSERSHSLKAHISSNLSLHHIKTGLHAAQTKWDICRAVCGIDDFFRASRSIVYVCICFIVTWTPYWTVILLSPFVGALNIPKMAVLVALWLFAVGTALNPFVYYFCNTEIRKGIWRVGKTICRRGCRSEKG